MDSLLGSSHHFPSPPQRSLFFSTPPFPPPSKPLSTRNAHKQQRARPIMQSMHQENSNGAEFCRRKTIIFVGFAAFPVLRLKAQAFQVEVADSVLQTNQATSPNFFVSLLNDFGIIGAGVLGALYAISQKEKDSLDANLESVRSKLMEKDSNIREMEKKYESELLSEKEIRSKQIKEENDLKQSLVDQLTMVNDIIARQGTTLQKERKLSDELKSQIDSLQLNLKKAGEDRLELQGKLEEKLDSIDVLLEKRNLLSSEIRSKEHKLGALSTAIAEKERAFSDLSFSYQQSEDQKKVLESGVRELKDDVQEYKTELESKNAVIDSLNAQMASFLEEKETLNKKVDVIQNQYRSLKNSSAEKEASDAKLLEEQRQKVNLLEKQLEITQNDDIIDKVLIYDLTQERNDLKTMLDIEFKNVKCLEQELQVTEDSLIKSMDEASDMTKQLQRTRASCSEFEDALSKVKAGFAEERESLQRCISDAKHNAENLACQLASAKDLLKQKVLDLKTISQEVITVAEIRDRLEKELTGALKKAETSIDALEKEKENSASLSNELKNLENEMSKAQEARKSLEENMNEAARSLDGSNQNVLTLSKDLELANSRISSLEDEKAVLQRNLIEQRRICQEARENLEDAHNLVMRHGKERETLEKKGEILEEELASAKHEILQLRGQKVFLRSPVNNQQNHDSGDSNAVPAKKTTSRRRISPPRENP